MKIWDASFVKHSACFIFVNMYSKMQTMITSRSESIWILRLPQDYWITQLHQNITSFIGQNIDCICVSHYSECREIGFSIPALAPLFLYTAVAIKVICLKFLSI